MRGLRRPRRPETALKIDAPLWMVSWADMVTLLLAIFVALYSISSLDAEKFRQLKQGLRGTVSPQPAAHPAPGPVEGQGPFRGPSPSGERWREGRPALAAGVLFEAGSSALTPAGQEALREVSRTLRGYGSRIELRGHCSAGEEGDARRLSYERAMAVYAFLTEEGGIPDRRLKITAMGTSDPVTPDRTAEEQARNRLVEVAELPDFSLRVVGR